MFENFLKSLIVIGNIDCKTIYKIFQHYGGDDRTCTKRGLKEALDAPAPSLENVTQRSSRQFETQDWGGGGGKLLETLIVSENYV